MRSALSKSTLLSRLTSRSICSEEAEVKTRSQSRPEASTRIAMTSPQAPTQRLNGMKGARSKTPTTPQLQDEPHRATTRPSTLLPIPTITTVRQRKRTTIAESKRKTGDTMNLSIHLLLSISNPSSQPNQPRTIVLSQ